jgi:hypothetical protein
MYHLLGAALGERADVESMVVIMISLLKPNSLKLLITVSIEIMIYFEFIETYVWHKWGGLVRNPKRTCN